MGTDTQATPEAVRRACEDVVLLFSACFDSGDTDRLLSLFAPDGVWKRDDREINGASELRAFMDARSSSVFVRHALTNLRTTIINQDNAIVESYVAVYRHVFDGPVTLPAPLEGPEVFARYRDQLVRLPGGWKIQERKTTVEFKHFE